MSEHEIKKVNVATRTIYLNEKINAENVQDAVIAIHDINDYDDRMEKCKKDYVRKPIKVVVDSFGGSVVDGIGVVTSILTSRTPIHTYCYSKAMSMGFIIFVAGHRRFAHRYTTFMSHQVSGGTIGTTQDMQESVEHTDDLNEMLMMITVERTKITREQLVDKKERKQDWYIFGTQALELGIVDELLKDTH